MRTKDYVDLYFAIEGKTITDYKNDKLTNSGLTFDLFKLVMNKKGYTDNSKLMNMFKNMTPEECLKFTVTNFENPYLRRIENDRVHDIILLTTLNSPYFSVRSLQYACNSFCYAFNLKPLLVDGKVGPNTIKYVNTICNGLTDVNKFVKIFIMHMANSYYDICMRNPSKKVWLKGWINRLCQTYYANVKVVPVYNKNTFYEALLDKLVI